MMRSAFVLILFLVAISCSDKRQELPSLIANDSMNVMAKEPANSTKKVPGGLIISNDNIKIFGDTTIEKEKIYLTSIKFEPYISFEDFQTDSIDKGSDKAVLDLSSKTGASRFKTRISTAYKADTVNFAGHYTFVWWGCGSPCQDAVIVDRRTGKVYDAPEAALGYDFKADSRMLIVNPTDSTGFYDNCFYCKPVIYLLNEKTKEFEEKHPR